MIMEKCSLDLRLSSVQAAQMQSCCRNSPANVVNSKEIIVIYNRRLCICDVTELQVRAIIEMARIGRELTALEVPLMGLGSPLGFSVKRSLQRFLQKRKKRHQTVAPYNYSPTTPSSTS